MSTPRSGGGTSLVLAGVFEVPAATMALLWDMDGVLLDTLTLDFEVVASLAERFAPNHPPISLEAIRANFAYDPPEFWRRLLAGADPALPPERFDSLVAAYCRIRRASTPQLNAGIREIMAAAREQGLRNAVVSNNPEVDVRQILGNAGIVGCFEVVVGNDQPGLAKKPAPDTYLEACRKLRTEPTACVVIEDSLLGAQAGHAAGCFTIGVATGAASLPDLQASPHVSATYSDFSASGMTGAPKGG